MIASSTYIEYYEQQYCRTLFIGLFSADVTISQGHLGAKLVEFSIAHIYCSVSCIELKLGLHDEEDITQQIITLYISLLGIFNNTTNLWPKNIEEKECLTQKENGMLWLTLQSKSFLKIFLSHTLLLIIELLPKSVSYPSSIHNFNNDNPPGSFCALMT